MSTPDLAAFVDEITVHRDAAYAATISAHEARDFRAMGVSGTEWFAYARTLSVLARTTSGAYGTPIDAQESPFDAINRPVLLDREDRKAVR